MAMSHSLPFLAVEGSVNSRVMRIMKGVKMRLVIALWVASSVFLGSSYVEANEVKILDVTARLEKGLFSDSYIFVVTLEHNDEGWSHFADRWEVWTPDGKTLLGTRSLAHPHVDEQPFTRSLSGVEIPDGIKQVLVKAHDLVHGESSDTFLCTLAENN